MCDFVLLSKVFIWELYENETKCNNMYYVSCTSQSKNEHTFPLFINANILPLNFLYYKTLSELMQGISTASAQLKYVIYLQQHPVSILTTHVLLLQKIFT